MDKHYRIVDETNNAFVQIGAQWMTTDKATAVDAAKRYTAANKRGTIVVEAILNIRQPVPEAEVIELKAPA